jgi:hypothetical protein
MAANAQLPEVFELEDCIVRLFPADRAAGFARLSQARRREIQSIIRRVYREAVDVAAQATDCLICGEPAPIEGRVLIAVERNGDHELGVICTDCARLGGLDART